MPDVDRGREAEMWTPLPIWRGKTAFVLASGPSLSQEIADKVRRERTIVVNSSYLLAPWADVLFFIDGSWYEAHRDVVANWPRMVVCQCPNAKRELPDKVRRVRGAGEPSYAPEFPAPGSPTIWQGRSGGHTAISLAIALGATRVIMLGFDMRLVNGREHHHNDYVNFKRERSEYARDFVPSFAGWNEAAKAAGVEILNATVGSAVGEFPMVDLDEVLTCDRS